MTAAPLAGRRVVVTRAREQAAELVDRLRGLGADVVELPAIAIGDPEDGGAALATAVHRLASGAYQWVALTSTNAAARVVAALGDTDVAPTVRWAAVGTATAQVLEDAGRGPVLVPEMALPEALVEVFPAADPHPQADPDPDPQAGDPRPVGPTGRGSGGTVLFPRAEVVRDVLAPGLRAKGWLVDEVVAYRTVAGRPDPAALVAARGADAFVFSSPSTVRHTIELLAPGPPVGRIVSIGPVTSDAARAAGLTVAAEARPHNPDGLVAAVVTVLGGHPLS
jgi:uroporphyrinogen-III synthase/uroporphyrinogen III methyltransferase/synthase